jgi:hypothetical protein
VKIEFHCHTEASFDCEDPLTVKALKYFELGFHRVYVTDHDELYKGSKHSIFSPGIEVSTTFGHIILLDMKYKPRLNTLWFIVLWSNIFGAKILIPHPNRKYTGLIERYNSRGIGLTYLNWFISKAKYIEHYNHREKDKLRTESIHASTFELLLKIEGVYTSDSHSLSDIYTNGTVIDNCGKVIANVEKTSYFKTQYDICLFQKRNRLILNLFNLFLSARRAFLYTIYGRL